LAGLIDGEGSVYGWTQRNSFGQSVARRVGIEVGMTDKEVPEWCKANFGGSLIRLTTKHKDIFRWTISGLASVELMKRVLPLMLIERKKEKIAKVIAFKTAPFKSSWVNMERDSRGRYSKKVRT